MEERSSVAVHLSQAYAEQLRRDKEQREKNRATLESITDVIRFLARQNLVSGDIKTAKILTTAAISWN